MTNRLGDADLSFNPSIGTPPSIGKHQVFISHRGIDMKRGFANQLYHRLCSHGIETFLDMEELPVGYDVRPYMLEAVRRASVQVPIFTATFAESVWCLDELVEMMKSSERTSKVIPVFYDVKSEDLRKKDGLFTKAIQVHREKGTRDEDTYKGWEGALKEASWLGGLWLEDYKKCEGELVNHLIQKIEQEINDRIRKQGEGERNTVGLEERVHNVVELCRLKEERNVFFLLLWGMGGIGKTTLARAIFDRLGNEFQVKSFVKDCDKHADQIQPSLLNDLLKHKEFEGTPEVGKERLKLGLCGKKVFIVLDDIKKFGSIEKVIHLESLHTGSLILVTSRNHNVFPHVKYLSDVFKGERYEVQGMGADDSLRLLCLRAFKKPSPEKGLEVEAERVSHACGGLPLSLCVVGDNLSDTKEKEVWKEAIEKLRTNQYQDIKESLMSSYNDLNDQEREMILDVACLLIGEDKPCAEYFWDGLVDAPRSALKSLVDGSLVKVCKKKRDKEYEEYECLTMHDQLRDLGRDIVEKEFKNSGNWSRVWRDTEVLKRWLRREKGLHQIRGFATSSTTLNTGLLSQMGSLQLLFINGGKLDGNDKDLEELGIRWLKLTSLPKVAATKISVLECQISVLEYLTVLELYGMEMELPFSDGQLKRLRKLVMVDGCSLSGDFGSLESLEELRATGLRLKKLPPSYLHLKKLRKLSIYIKELEDLPEDFGSLKRLEELDVRDSSITNLPSSFGKLEKLRKLSIVVSKDLEYLPENFGSLANLEELNVSRSAIRKLPSSFVQLKKLRKLDVSWCVCLEQLPEEFGCLESLEELDARNSSITELPLWQLEKLQKLKRGLCHGLDWDRTGRNKRRRGAQAESLQDPALCDDLENVN